MYDIHIALSWEFRELITRESETILPLFLSYSAFYRSSVINVGLLLDLTVGLVTIIIIDKYSFRTAF